MTSIYDTPGVKSAVQSIISGSTGSQTDVSAIIDALVNAKVAGRSSMLTAKQAAVKTQTSAVGSLKSALVALKDATRSLGDGSLLSGLIAKGDGKGLSATAGRDAVAGSYAITVDQIATAQNISSGAFDAGTKLGEGKLTLSVGGKTINVDINSSNNTLSGIASAINKASGSANVTATVLNAADGAHLVLRSTATGADSGISVAVDLAGDSSSTALTRLNVTSSTSTVDPNDPGKTVMPYTVVDAASDWTQSVAGHDASLTVAGMRVTSASNQIENTITGLSLSIGAESVGTTQTLTVERDVTAQKAAIGVFVTAYNDFVSTAAGLASYDASAPIGSQAGPLLGDSMLKSIRNDLANLVSRGSGSDGNAVSLAAIGVSLQSDGKLKIDDTAMTAALTSSPDGMRALFRSSTGLAATIASHVELYVRPGGMIDSRSQAIDAETKSLTQQQAQLTDYSKKLNDQYTAQFSALNDLMAQMNSSMSYLSRLFGSGSNPGTLNAR